MGSLLEKPAFWLLIVPAVIIGLIVLVVVLLTRGRRQAPPPAAPAPSVVGAPGWYPQPDGSQRYWNGAAWTDDTA